MTPDASTPAPLRSPLWIALEGFEGSLEDLVDFLRKKEQRTMLWRFSLHELLDSLCRRVNDLFDVGDLLELGSTLVKWKSELALLAARAENPADEVAVQERMAAMAAKLLHYRDLVRRYREREGQEAYPRQVEGDAGEVRRFPDGAHIAPSPAEAAMTNLHALAGAWSKLAADSTSPPPQESTTEPVLVIDQEERTVAAAMDDLLRQLEDTGVVLWSSFADRDLRNRVCLFLALLELLREKAIRAEQPTPFGEIEISLVLEATP